MTSVSRGRPLASSRETLADAACELFLEQGYETTTVADLTRRAGVSRSSFFNYFDGKAATIWYALDEQLSAQAQAGAGTAVTDVHALAARLGAAPLHTLALAIANSEAMGVTAELETGRALRQAALARTLRGPGRADLAAELRGGVQAAAVFAAIWHWAQAGAGTHSLEHEVRSALETAQLPRFGDPLRVAVIGAGAIGAPVIAELALGRISGATLAGVVTRGAGSLVTTLSPVLGDGAGRVTDFGADIDRAVRESDLVVECAGIPALSDYGPEVITRGGKLLIVSIGALANPGVRAQLLGGPGTLRLVSGAIGGLDVLRAAARGGGGSGDTSANTSSGHTTAGITTAAITSTKRAATLVQPWMGEAEAAKLRDTAAPFVLFEGSVREAVERFPASLNVACALAHATGLWDETVVRLVADPAAVRTTHEIAASGSAGDYAFSITNAVSETNPTSSAVVAESVLAGITTLAQPSGSFV